MAACGLASLNMLQQNPSGMVKSKHRFQCDTFLHDQLEHIDLTSGVA